MTELTNQGYLKDCQYKDARNLEARIALHRKFSTNSYPWFWWVFDQLTLKSGFRVLEVGCGSGRLWQENCGRVPAGVIAILGDLSKGMAGEARRSIADMPGYAFLALDTQMIPSSSETFDLVIANHMLYHVPDLQKGLQEIYRVLKPGGRLAAATNGLGHMKEINQLLLEYQPGLELAAQETRRYSLENASAVLAPFFRDIEVRIYEDGLHVTEVEPLAAYMLSQCGVRGKIHDDELDSLCRFLQETAFAKAKSFRITKSQGLVIARK